MQFYLEATINWCLEHYFSAEVSR